MIVGMHDMLACCREWAQSRVSTEGALWILMMDGLFLIPVVFAAFFYPWQMLIAFGIVLILTVVLIEAVHVVRTRRFGWRRT